MVSPIKPGRCCGWTVLAVMSLAAGAASGLPDECRKLFRPSTDISKTPGDNGFRLKVAPGTTTYAPGHNYTITLQGWRTQYSVQKFVGFWIRAVPRDGRIRSVSAGKFEHFNEAIVAYSGHCSNVVTNRTSVPRSEVQIQWRAPKHGSGCIQIRATVMEYKNIWYQEEGGLIMELCEEEQADQEQIPEQAHEGCCVCDDAKYELLFTGIWSPQTHQKDFPTTQWFTHFSDIIGATHTPSFKVYEIGGYASDGLKQLAEWGKTQELEKELKTKTKDIRTIVKARGLWYPNLNGQTHAVFRTDQKHHLLSLASMFGPSPDWLVGIDSLNLCLKNCSWLDRREVDLYPFDAGTDSGVTYMSENSPTHPRDRIQNITTRWPKNPISPFYDPSGKAMIPLAKLIITKLKIYEKACDDPNSPVTSEEVISPPGAANRAADNRMECAVDDWGLWSTCSGPCGQGAQMRTRSYRIPAKAAMNGCSQTLVEKQMCSQPCDSQSTGQASTGSSNDISSSDGPNCMTSPWSEWSACSATCGTGMRTRSRMFKDPMGEKLCSDQLMEKEECSDGDCQQQSPECRVTNWSSWSPCSATCGKGTQARRRQFLRARDATSCQVTMTEKRGCIANRTSCDFDPMEQKVVCMQSKQVGSCYGFMPRWYFDAERAVCQPFVYSGCRGNMNNFETYEECNRVCERAFAPLPSASPLLSSTTARQQQQHTGQPVDCHVTTWSAWTACSVTCGRGFQDRYRQVVTRPQNGGSACPSKMDQRRKCNLPACQNQHCVFGDWSSWMPCTQSCGDGMQQRMRLIKQMPPRGAHACAYVPVETRLCPGLPRCEDETNEDNEA
ncbi:Spondin-1 [Hypsibius exemplaris]|uniref:Spondin-1 n=1 Tax=Hypsibius exemplaris TaxID=2072580 RepID=A0A9X6NED4_HYPEX|nr:Spondin-1 [Hypsibius exemplaris]